jgi:hypothetical protein
MKKIYKALSVAVVSAFMLAGVGQANASSVCTKAAELKGYVDEANAAIASKSTEKMVKVLHEMGAHPSKDEESASEAVLKKLVQVQLGSAYTGLKLATAACSAFHAYHRHRHLVCGWWRGHNRVSRHNRHGHHACRMRD